MSENLFLLYFLYPPAVLWTGALSAGKLPLNEHVCIHKIGLCVVSENLFLLYLLYPLAVLWTGALSGGKLPLHEHVCILKIGFCVMSENLFLLYILYPPAVLWTGALSAGKLPLNEHVCAYSLLDFCVKFYSFYVCGYFISFNHFVCCELVHSVGKLLLTGQWDSLPVCFQENNILLW